MARGRRAPRSAPVPSPFPKRGAEKEVVLSELSEASAADNHFLDGRVLSSMCTAPHPLAVRAHAMFIEANLGNPGLYPGTKALEEKVVSWLADLYHGRGCAGHIVGGGTEANITALWLARNLSGKREVVFPKSAHFSLRKACDLLGLRAIPVGTLDDFTVDVDAAARAVSKDTAAVVGIAGTTEVGAIDDIKGLAEAADGAFLHVDAAWGGFVLPFLGRGVAAARRFDFSIEEVSSLGTDPHKMGMSTIPSGALLIRDGRWLDRISVDAPYLTQHRQTALSGTRCSAAVASTYAAIRHIGRDGYVRIVGDAMKVARHIAKRVVDEGFELALKPPLSIINISFQDPGKVQAALLEKGWHLSVAREPRSLRVVVMPHVTMKSADGFVDALAGVARELRLL